MLLFKHISKTVSNQTKRLCKRDFKSNQHTSIYPKSHLSQHSTKAMSGIHEQDKLKNTSKAAGSWVRSATMFHDRISNESGAAYPPEAGRYRLYVSYACPWAHRTLMVRKLKGLEEVIPITVTDYTLPNVVFTKDQTNDYKGWEFVTKNGLNKNADHKNVFYEPHGFKTLSELYELAHPGYTKEYKALAKRPVYSVPVLFDEKNKKIVSNESAEIIVMLNEEFNSLATNPDFDLNPAALREEMEKVNSIVYPAINDGVYRCGFARTQEAYEDAYHAHWRGMDEIEAVLGRNKFLCGDKLTLSDIRLFVTLIRYDVVYFAHFKTNRNMVRDMPNMLRFMKEIYNMQGIKDTVNIEFIVKHYYGSQRTVNPTGIWPLSVLQPDVLSYLEN